jgi:hypothetical protein
MIEALDGPSSQGVIPVSNSVVSEVKVGVTVLDERKVVTIQPSGKIRVYFGDGSTTPSAATVLSDGFKHGKDSIRSYEASSSQILYIVSDTGASINVTIAERA